MIQSNPIKVLLVDDHMVVRSGLSTVLSVYDDMELVGEACDGKEALRLCEQLQPDIILMDLLMPRMDGVTAIQAVKQRWPQIQIIALTSFKEKEYVEGALKAGASGYLLKNVSADELVNSIRRSPPVSPVFHLRLHRYDTESQRACHTRPGYDRPGKRNPLFNGRRTFQQCDCRTSHRQSVYG